MQIIIQKIPESLQEFEALAAGQRTPEKISALFLCALSLFDRRRERHEPASRAEADDAV